MDTFSEPEKRGPIVTDEDIRLPKKPKIVDARDNRGGVAPVKPEYVLERRTTEKLPSTDEYIEPSPADAGTKKRQRGQNKSRKFHFAGDEVKLCQSLVLVRREGLFKDTKCQYAENAPKNAECNNKLHNKKNGRNNGYSKTGDVPTDNMRTEESPSQPSTSPTQPLKCQFEHNLREYLKNKKGEIPGICMIWQQHGTCAAGWRCKWLSSHSKEENGELFLVNDDSKIKEYDENKKQKRAEKFAHSKWESGNSTSQDWEKDVAIGGFDDPYGEIVNNVPVKIKISLRKNEYPLQRSRIYQEWLGRVKQHEDALDHAAGFTEPPPRPEEKRKIYIGRETPLLAPLTTTGNIPFRRLCVDAGAAITYSEMAMSPSLLSGHKPEWALLRAHSSELPHFGVQLCANKVDQAVRATEAITSLFPTTGTGRHGLSLIDLNCGCPIDLVYKKGGGSALLDQQNKLVRILKGMNYVSGETPITCKIRMGTKDAAPTAQKLVQRLVNSGDVQAITLHGRSRQQRYTRAADWGYIAETAALIDSLNKQMDAQTDTGADGERTDRNRIYFIGNGDCYSHVDYFNAVDNAKVDSVMVARGALIKPWIFEEIEKGQYLDKSASERLDLVRDYCRYGLECWGADELGVATTRRFLLEWLSFTCRYVPLGILERLPPNIQDRPPPWKGRNEMETLLGSNNYKDWIKISELFLGPCPPDFFFTPKHKVCDSHLCIRLHGSNQA
ncbi:hypothetical protein EDC01DRAFT_621740 [Geopyxis carbonaria]|nr:hypothetical protein EDC01DRAFT_621740 [Geopyxis carbonaria]